MKHPLALRRFGIAAAAALAALLFSPSGRAECAETFRKLKLPEGLAALERETRTLAASDRPALHELSVKDGRGYVRIGILLQSDISYAQALAAAVREGSVAEINAGNVVGAKVLPMLARIASHGPKGGSLVVHGKVSPKAILETVEMFKNEAPGSPEFISEGNLRLLLGSMEKLRMLDACKRIWKVSRLELCGPMQFRLDSAKGEPQWEAAAD
jgi:hypothetical protein